MKPVLFPLCLNVHEMCTSFQGTVLCLAAAIRNSAVGISTANRFVDYQNFDPVRAAKTIKVAHVARSMFANLVPPTALDSSILTASCPA